MASSGEIRHWGFSFSMREIPAEIGEKPPLDSEFCGDYTAGQTIDGSDGRSTMRYSNESPAGLIRSTWIATRVAARKASQP
jgi:hypothetical protein